MLEMRDCKSEVQELRMPLYIKVHDQDNVSLIAEISVSVSCGPEKKLTRSYVSLCDRTDYEYSEILITVSYKGQTQQRNASSKYEDFRFQIDKPKPKPQPKPKIQPPPSPRRQYEVRVRETITEKVEIKENIPDEVEPLDLEEEDETCEFEEGQFGNIDSVDTHTYDVVHRLLKKIDDDSLDQVQPIISDIKRLSRKFNVIFEKFEAAYSYQEYLPSKLNIGKIDPKRTMKNIQKGNFTPIRRVTHHNLIEYTKNDLIIFMDVSASTNLGLDYKDESTTILNALKLAVLSITYAMIKLRGEVFIILFSDKKNSDHLRILHFTSRNFRGDNLSVNIFDFLQIQGAGGTCLNEALEIIIYLIKSKVVDENSLNDLKKKLHVSFPAHYSNEDQINILKSLKKKLQTMNFLFLLDGAPMKGYFRFDEDDAIQQQTISSIIEIKEHKKKGDLRFLWESSPVNDVSLDRQFFKKLKDESCVIVSEIPNFFKFLKEIGKNPFLDKDWNKIPKQPHFYKFSTDIVFPFKFADEDNAEVNNLLRSFRSDDKQKMVENVKNWVRDNIKYSYVLSRPYQAAEHIFKAPRHGCCGEISNLIVAFLRHLGVPAGILSVDYYNNVRIHHAAVGLTIDNANYVIDLAMGTASTADIKAKKYPVSDKRWVNMISVWQESPVILKNEQSTPIEPTDDWELI